MMTAGPLPAAAISTQQPESSEPTLAQCLRSETRTLHTLAERSGVMRSLLRGDLQRAPYCRLLRNLLVIYSALEAALEQHSHHRLIAPFYDPRLFRCASLSADLDALHGPGWSMSLETVGAATEYSNRIEQCAESAPDLLIAHAYVRYLGDLSGGQILAAIVRKSMHLDDDSGSRFYDFGADGAGPLARRFRAALDAMPATDEAAARIIAEAQWAFTMHVRLFAEIAQAPG